ncbi:MAG: PAS domain S-box protein [Rhodoferax sp.]|nr:PAS domain S-box protein [Rhodoferax sp.]
MRRPRVSVAVTVIVALVSVITVFLAALGVGNFQWQKQRAYAQLQQEIDYCAEQLAAAVALPLWNFDQDQIKAMLDSAMRFDAVAGLVLQSSNKVEARARDANWAMVRQPPAPDAGAAIQAERVVLVAQQRVGNLRIYASTRFIDRQLQQVMLQTLAAILVIDTLLVLSLYYVLWRSVLRPLQRIEAFAVQAGAGAQPVSLQGQHFHGELESLRQAIEHMLGLLASRLHSLQQQSAQLTEQERHARLNELRVAQILKASPLPITVGNLHTGVYVRVNPAWERQFQYREAEVLGKTSVQLGFWKDMNERQGWIDRFNAEGRVSGYEVSFRMQDGQPRVFMLSSERFVYGSEECVLTMSVDVTERKLLESELLQLNSHLEQRVLERTQALDRSHQELLLTMQRLEQAQQELTESDKLASLGSLVAGVAHELNTPLGNALMAASSMAEEVERMQQTVATGAMKRSAFEHFMGRVAEGADLTLRSLQRAVALISSFKQVAVDQASERRRGFDLAQVLNEVIDTLRPQLKRASARLELHLQEGIAMESYPGPLGQVIINLFTNALAHGLEGRDSGLITVSTRRLGNSQVQIHVADDGAGIAPEHLGQIFDPFFTTKLGRGGSGLGLSVSHRIVTKVLGGQISIRSRPGQGARFELRLPTSAPDVVA